MILQRVSRGRRSLFLCALLSLGVLLCAAPFGDSPAKAQPQSCMPGFGPPAPEDNCDFVPDFRNPMPSGYLSIALSRNLIAGSGAGQTQAEASRKAVAACKTRGGQNCAIAWSAFNQCAAVAGSAPEKLVAIEALKGPGWNASGVAMGKCEASGGRSCHVLVAACYNGYMSPRPWTPPGQGQAQGAPQGQGNGYPAYTPPVLRRR